MSVVIPMGNFESVLTAQVNVISIEYPGYGLLQGIEPTEEVGCRAAALLPHCWAIQSFTWKTIPH